MPNRKYDSLLDDPDVEVWKDGSLWHHKKSTDGSTAQYTLLRGPLPPENTTVPHKEEGYDWVQHLPGLAFGLAMLFAILGVLALASMISGREIGCTHLLSATGNDGCWIILPHR